MKRMLISVDHDEWRAAIVNDGRLEQLEIEPVDRDSCRGNIYRAVVARVEPSLQSAFVDFGRDKQGFMPVGEIHPKLRGNNKDKRAPIQDILKAGTEILVQVVRDEIGNKGATLSTFISLPGRYLVLMPETDKSGVSRKLSDSARTRVKELTEKMQVPDGFGLIVRTSGETATKLELSKDLVYLNRLWAHVNKRFESGKGPEMLYMERTLPIRFVRDYFSRDVKEVVVDDEETLREVAAYVKLLMPRNLSAMESYSGAVPLFARYGIQGQVESVFSRQVALPSGGSIVIDQTEALVAVDVNSGRVKGKDIEDTARATNIEAAQEVARQLVLRDLGGLVVVDFIDMRERKYVRAVEAAMKAAMKPDKARHKISQISEFGLIELSRQRLKSSVNKGVFEACTQCSGTGFSRTSSAIASSVMRRIYEYIAQGEVRYVIAMLPPEAANYLLNKKRTELANVEREYHVSIEIIGVDGMSAAEVVIERQETEPVRSGSERMAQNRQRRVSQKLDLVRNKLIQREETRVHRGELAKKSGALLDFGQIYQEVREATAEAEKDEKAAGERRAHQREQRKRNDERRAMERAAKETGEEVGAPSPYDTDNNAPAGFFGWLKDIFSVGPTPTAADELPAPVVEEALESPPDEPEPSEGRSSSRNGRRRRNDRRPQSRRSGRDDGRGRNDNRGRQSARDGDDGAKEDGGEEDTRRRRRRRSSASGADVEDKAAGSANERGKGSGGRRSRRGAGASTKEEGGRGGDAASDKQGGEPAPKRRRRRRGGRGRSRAGGENAEANNNEGAAKVAKETSTETAAEKATEKPSEKPAVKTAKESAEETTKKPAETLAETPAGPLGTPPPLPTQDVAAGEVAPPPLPTTDAKSDTDADTAKVAEEPAASDASESAEDSPETVEMADATELARQEIERLKGQQDEVDEGEEAQEGKDMAAAGVDGTVVPAADEPAQPSNRFVIDLRSDTSRSEGP